MENLPVDSWQIDLSLNLDLFASTRVFAERYCKVPTCLRFEPLRHKRRFELVCCLHTDVRRVG